MLAFQVIDPMAATLSPSTAPWRLVAAMLVSYTQRMILQLFCMADGSDLENIRTASECGAEEKMPGEPPHGEGRVVCSRSRRYNAVSISVVGAGDSTCSSIATRSWRHHHAIWRE